MEYAPSGVFFVEPQKGEAREGNSKPLPLVARSIRLTLPFHLTRSNITWNDRLRNAHPLQTEAVFRFLIEGISHGTFHHFLSGRSFSQWQPTSWSKIIGLGIR